MKKEHPLVVLVAAAAASLVLLAAAAIACTPAADARWEQRSAKP